MHVGVSRIARMAMAGCLVLAIACSRDPAVAKKEYFENGNRYFDKQQYAEAIVEYRNAIKIDQAYGDARYKLAEALARTDRIRDAFGEYVRAADLLPENAEVQLKAGALLLLAGQYEEARGRADRVLAASPKNTQAQILRANALAGLRDLDGAIGEIEEAILLDPGGSAAYANLGALQLAKGQNKEAEAAFKRAVDADPKSVTAQLGLANFYWATGRRQEAEAGLLKAVEIDPKNALANRALATFYVASGQPGRAEPFLKAIVVDAKDSAPRLMLADYYLTMRRPAEAVPLLEVASKEDAFFVAAQSRLAAVEYTDGKREEAHKRIDDVIAKQPTAVQSLLVKARFLIAENRWPEALVRAKAAVDADSRSAPAQYTLGLIHASTNDTDNAISAFNEVLKLNPRAVAAQLQLSRLELRKGRADTSVQLAEQAMQSDPKNAVARLFLARGLLLQGEIARAEAESRKLIADFPNAATVYAQLGAVLISRRDFKGARQAFEKAEALDADSFDAVNGLVGLDVIEKKPKQARERVERALARQPNSGPVLILAARTYAADRDMDAAEKTLRRAIEVDSANLVAYGMLGQVYLSQRRLDEAAREFDALAERQQNPVAANTMVAMILQSQGKNSEARSRYERVVQMDSRAAVAANNLAWMYAEEGGNLDVALQLAQTAKQQLPEQAEVNDTLGFVYLKKELPSLAIPPLQLSVEKEPQNPVFRYRLGVAYAKVGDKAAAKRELERALKLRPDFEGADEARQLLATL